MVIRPTFNCIFLLTNNLECEVRPQNSQIDLFKMRGQCYFYQVFVSVLSRWATEILLQLQTLSFVVQMLSFGHYLPTGKYRLITKEDNYKTFQLALKNKMQERSRLRPTILFVLIKLQNQECHNLYNQGKTKVLTGCGQDTNL